MKINAIVFGATGMVGEGVLLEALGHEQVESVLVIGRRPCNVTHPKLKEIVHHDFYNISSLEEQLKGCNACYFCLGVSSVGMKEPEYTRITYNFDDTCCNDVIEAQSRYDFLLRLRRRHGRSGAWTIDVGAGQRKNRK